MCVSLCLRVSVSSCILPSCVHPTFFRSQYRPQVCLRLVYWRVWIRIYVNTRDGKKVLFSNGNFFAHECFLWTNYLYADSNKKITIRRLWISSSKPKRHQKKRERFSALYLSIGLENAFLFILLFWLWTSLEGIILYIYGWSNEWCSIFMYVFIYSRQGTISSLD